ncbi:1-acyl-sn-glycerol-3-phosphate acyltransferase [Paludibacter sp. 221]|uniref:1-acyl-sn-glycerol-3-phosphate acyltransferase n=1 Tax=Paludibacter sp. 221 TaxID=2302939 RepID=UPI00194374E6|nr:1-acyl-sn-glycerol-3-phosphate acyltransferase [Paludibacter sp. 221]
MNFDDIRFYADAEIPEVMERLVGNKQFVNLLSTLFPLVPKDILKEQLLTVVSTDDFQRRFAYPFLKDLEANKTKGVDFYGLDSIDRTKPYLYISNHRDITIDSVFLCLLMIENKMNTVGIAIGDNLLIYPWIEDFVRLNRSFIVKRGLNVRQALEASQKLSAYIRYLIKGDSRSIWIAQREGRSKDSNDRTQDGLLRMLTLSSEKGFYDNLSELNICPLTISYEYDPTDYLKAKEYQLKRDNPEYKKRPEDDLENMQVGIMGYRGKVDYRISGDINDSLKNITEEASGLKEQISLLAKVIDRKIHSNYTIFKVNKIAYDLLKGEKRFAGEYTDTERFDFEHYISKQIAKVDIENRDSFFLRTKMLEMYANPLLNYMNV